MKFRVKLVDTIDKEYDKEGLHDFLAIDKARDGISIKIINNMRRLLRGIAMKMI